MKEYDRSAVRNPPRLPAEIAASRPEPRLNGAPPMHVPVITVVLMISAVFVALPVSAQGAVPARSRTPEALVVPQWVGEFTLQSERRFEDPSAGAQYRYRAAGPLYVDVFIYPVEQRGRRKAAALRAEADKFKVSLEGGAERGWYEAYALAWEEATQVRAGRTVVPGRSISFIFRRDGQEWISIYYIFVLGEEFVKVRTSIPYGGEEDLDAPQFVELLITALATRT